ncbi:hypothetical protein GP486_003553 [Trichoglossum hirsutum]|uniref:Nucleoside phosphorylase domain-containing protein n=1 Tax=Trichoglossum hirsutum TaxID=265104 RepID=A0A9P8LCW6_9PEZI|nr:hypothetical protein GP486_003553 [Trichoglossum hirsutum]
MADDPTLNPPERKDFEIAIICALGKEARAVEAMFDHIWENADNEIGKLPSDKNSYTMGQIGRHYIVQVWMPEMGKTKAALVAHQLKSSFTEIKHVLVVGVCGGVPHEPDGGDEILLGDVVISTKLIEYDSGRQYPGMFSIRDDGYKPDLEVRALLSKLQSSTSRGLKEVFHRHLKDLLSKEYFSKARYPGAEEDRLYKSDYIHKHQGASSCGVCAGGERVCDEAINSTCASLECSKSQLEQRPRLEKIRETATKISYPAIHFGHVGSADRVMKSAKHRDSVAKSEKVIAFEMEGAGVSEVIPSVVVIKGVCDYADSHKNNTWQGYAAVTAAACTKAFLNTWGKPSLANQSASIDGKPEHLRPKPQERANQGDSVPESEHDVGSTQDDQAPSLPAVSPKSTFKVDPKGHETSSIMSTEDVRPYSWHSDKTPKIAVKEIPSDETNPQDSSELLQACEERNMDRIVKLLKSPGISLSATDNKGRGVLHLVLGDGKVNANKSKMTNVTSIVRLLTTHRPCADVNAVDNSGLRPIHHCAMTINSEAALCLLKNGARINEPDRKGRTALHYVAMDPHPSIEFAQMLISKGAKLGSARLPNLPPKARKDRMVVRELIKP